MAKYSICFPDAFVCVPVQMAPQEFDPWEYTKDCFYLWNNGSVHWVEFYFKVPDYDSVQDQPAARLIRFVASEMSWTPESGLSMIVDTDHMYVDPGHDDWFIRDIPFDQQDLVVATDLTRELFFSSWRMLGWQISRID
jgi:hypothetical protein